MNWSDLLQIRASLVNGLEIQIGIIGFLILAVLAGGALFAWRRWFREWQAESFDVSLGNIGTVTIKRNHDVARIAHKAWTEMQTRKAALPFDENHDVITEIYDSWYSLFKEFRSLIKEIPAEQIAANEDTQKLIQQMVNVLNVGLRPHLTQWQAKFRWWFDKEKAADQGSSPQEIQKKFPEYQNLITDLKNLNAELQKYSDFLQKVAHGK